MLNLDKINSNCRISIRLNNAANKWISYPEHEIIGYFNYCIENNLLYNRNSFFDYYPFLIENGFYPNNCSIQIVDEKTKEIIYTELELELE